MGVMSPERAKQGLASLVIVACLGLQGAATFGSISSLTWPFMDYPMYRRAYGPGDPINEKQVVGRLRDGSDIVITPEAAAMTFWQFQRNVVYILGDFARGQEGDRRPLETLRDHYRQRHQQDLAELRLENHPIRITPEGIRLEPVEVIAAVRFEEPAAP